MLVLGVRYLTGYAVATDVSDRYRAEWPPHPARVFMAMAAAYFETEGDPKERAALEWLEQQAPPAMYASDAGRRCVVTSYVPPNDFRVARYPEKVRDEKIASALAIIPDYRRSRQPRTFPCVRPHDETVYLFWAATPDAPCLAALDQLCAKVIRIGHSSSFVQMWRADSDRVPAANLISDAAGTERMRITSAGVLESLRSSYNREAIERHAALGDAISSSRCEQRHVRGSGTRERRLAIERRIEELTRERDGITPRPPIRPTIGRWRAYRRVSNQPESLAIPSGAFASDMTVLSVIGGPTLGLETTWRVLTAVRDTILSTCGPVVPEWISGHQPDGSPSMRTHLALVPLAFVTDTHADGHLMGVGLVFPKEVGRRERGRGLRGLLFDGHGQPRHLRVVLGRLGEWTLAHEMLSVAPLALRLDTWIAASDTWATVTPTVLDRSPRTHRTKGRASWSSEIAAMIAASCERQGLPAPVQVDVGTTSWHRGAPRAIPGVGGGYPLRPVKHGQPVRPQVHALLRFDRPVAGPLILGAGRFRGYGVCKPLTAGGR